MYNVGKPEESFEWTRLSELTAAELAMLPPAGMQQPAAQAPALPPPSPELRAAASQAVAAALSAALQTGLSAATLHSLVDAAAAQQQQLPQALGPLSRLRVK
jgi:hypothetical protein